MAPITVLSSVPHDSPLDLNSVRQPVLIAIDFVVRQYGSLIIENSDDRALEEPTFETSLWRTRDRKGRPVDFSSRSPILPYTRRKLRFYRREVALAASMTRDDIQLLYEYDRWANNRVLQAASALSTEAFTRDLGGSFRSVRDTLVHIIGGEWIWLAYWRTPSHSPAILTDLRTERDALFNPGAFPDVASVQSKWSEIEKQQTEFVDRITNELLENMLPFRNTQVRLGHLMQHLANHSTYHRGQVALMMRQLAAKPVATDFHVFLAEGRREGAH